LYVRERTNLANDFGDRGKAMDVTKEQFNTQLLEAEKEAGVHQQEQEELVVKKLKLAAYVPPPIIADPSVANYQATKKQNQIFHKKTSQRKELELKSTQLLVQEYSSIQKSRQNDLATYQTMFNALKKANLRDDAEWKKQHQRVTDIEEKRQKLHFQIMEAASKLETTKANAAAEAASHRMLMKELYGQHTSLVKRRTTLVKAQTEINNQLDQLEVMVTEAEKPGPAAPGRGKCRRSCSMW